MMEMNMDIDRYTILMVTRLMPKITCLNLEIFQCSDGARRFPAPALLQGSLVSTGLIWNFTQQSPALVFGV